jgi:hypothetical protein
MAIHYYLLIFPMEALIASQLDPSEFALYMATGTKKGSEEQIMFIEIEGGFSGDFDWEYAKEKCVPHPEGGPKKSVYLGVYRIFERVPLDALRKMYLTTRDGRSISLEKQQYEPPSSDDHEFFIYQELCPVNAVIVSSLEPKEYGAYITDPQNKIYMPAAVYTDLKVINFDDPVRTGNIGTLYDGKLSHLKQCISEISGPEKKTNKTLTRTHVESFAFQAIQYGLYVYKSGDIFMYRMPSVEEIKKIDFHWGRSANII